MERVHDLQKGDADCPTDLLQLPQVQSVTAGFVGADPLLLPSDTARHVLLTKPGRLPRLTQEAAEVTHRLPLLTLSPDGGGHLPRLARLSAYKKSLCERLGMRNNALDMARLREVAGAP